MTTSEVSKLRAAIKAKTMELIDHIDVVVKHDDLGQITVSAPSYMAQLQDAISQSFEVSYRPSGRGAPSTRVPISMDAIGVVARISLDLEDWLTVIGNKRLNRSSIEERVAVVSAGLCQFGDAQLLCQYILAMAEWVKSIVELLDPKPKYHLSAKCPNCGHRSAKRFNGNDEEWVRTPALVIVDSPQGPVCKCLACATEWPEGHFLLLAKAIGC